MYLLCFLLHRNNGVSGFGYSLTQSSTPGPLVSSSDNGDPNANASAKSNAKSNADGIDWWVVVAAGGGAGLVLLAFGGLVYSKKGKTKNKDVKMTKSATVSTLEDLHETKEEPL